MRISVRIGAKVVRIRTNQIIKLETLKKLMMIKTSDRVGVVQIGIEIRFRENMVIPLGNY